MGIQIQGVGVEDDRMRGEAEGRVNKNGKQEDQKRVKKERRRRDRARKERPEGIINKQFIIYLQVWRHSLM